MTQIEVLSSYNPIPGFLGSTVMNTSVTKIEKKEHQIGYYFSKAFGPICTYIHIYMNIETTRPNRPSGPIR